MSYQALGQTSSPSTATTPTTLGPDVSIIPRARGWVAIPGFDLREYVRSQIITAAAGFAVGVSVGALLGNVFTKARSVLKPNRRRLRRNSRRRRTSRSAEAGLAHRQERETSRRERELLGSDLRRYEDLVNQRLDNTGDRYQAVRDGDMKRLAALDKKKVVLEAEQDQILLAHGPLAVKHFLSIDHTRRDRLLARLSKNRVRRNTNARRRSRPRGRPTVRPVASAEMDLGKLGYVSIDRGVVTLSKGGSPLRTVGSVYDLDTAFRAVPRFHLDPVREFATLAGAARYLARL